MSQSTRESKPKTPSIKPNGIDFQSLADKHGYVKARQMLAQVTIQSQQAKIKSVEQELNSAKRPLRLNESINIASTFGNFNSDSVLDRIMKGNQGGLFLSESSQIDILEGMLNKKRKLPTVNNNEKDTKINDSSTTQQEQIHTNTTTDINTTTITPLKEIPKLDGPEYQFLEDDTLRYALESDSYTLLVPNKDIEELPGGLGDTLNLQLGYVKRLICTRNKLRGLLTHETPQLSMYHMRYMTQINLSFNKITKLPCDFGILIHLETLDLSYNNLSTLPESFRQLKNLITLNMSGNSFSQLPNCFSYLNSLENLNLNENLFTSFPYMITKLNSIKKIKFSKNSLTHLAIYPPLLTKEDMWTKIIDRRTGKMINMNILTNEKLFNIEKYDGYGVRKKKNLHIFQNELDVKLYKQRKIWLSINSINEYDIDHDNNTGLIYYRNNISGNLTWEMPTILDTIGNIQKLEYLEIKQNSIKTLPNSFINMINIKKLILTKNRINILPIKISNLINLEYLEISSNELKLLPIDICNCQNLEILLLNDNHILRLPENLGDLPKLKKLDISSNNIKHIVYSLGYCDTLEIINILENPIIDPSIEVFNKDILEIKWVLRNKFLINSRGMPPKMDFHNIGIKNQVTILKPEFHSIIQQMINTLKKDSLLNLQLLGLTEIPVEIYKIPSLKRLKLDFNENLHFDKEGFNIKLKSLITLSMRACKLYYIPYNIYVLYKLHTLSIHENCLESLPETIIELQSLTYLGEREFFL